MRLGSLAKLLLVGLLFLGGCAGETGKRPQSWLQDNYEVRPSPTFTPVITVPPTSKPTAKPSATSNADCVDVKSRQLDIGNSKGKLLCIEGTILSIQVSNRDKTAEINLDTKTGTMGASLYSMEVYIADILGYGLENLDKIAEGQRIRARGLFSENYIGSYIVKLESPQDLEIIG